MRYGIVELEGTEKTTPFSLWSGAFMSTWEAEGRYRHGSSSVTVTTYNGDKVRISLPKGVTFPRTDENYFRIDVAISDAMNAYEASRGSVQLVAS